MKDRKYTFPEALWAGNDHSLELAMDVHEMMMAGMFDAPMPNAGTEADKVPYNFAIQGNVGIVQIHGPLVNNDSPYNQYRGVTSYADVRRAMIYAATQEGVKAILLDINSGGGAVAGVADAGNLIANIDKSIKPVYAFTDGAMASAAYWLGVSTRGVYASDTSMIGSIGVIATHKEYSKLFKEMGIGVTVMRSGEFKALVNMHEPLTDPAKAQVQEQLDQAYGVFATHASGQLGVTLAKFEATMGQGREFFGASAVKAGLAKDVKTFDSMVSFIEKKVIDTSEKRDNTPVNFQRGPNMTRQALTEQQVAAIAAGALTPEAAAAAAAEAAAAQTPEAIAAAAAAAEAATAAAATAAAAAPAEGTLVTYLQSQIKDKDAAFLAQTIELKEAKARAASMEATHGALVKVAATQLSNMKVALGLSRADFSAMAPELLLAELDATVKTFQSKFPVGGVAAVTPPVDRSNDAAAPDLMREARLAATRLPTHTK